MFKYLVLGLLRDEQPRHGYALMKAYRTRSGLQIPTGNFYRELARLLADGEIEPAERAASADPRRAPYRITAEGERRFDEWLAAPLRASDAARVDDLALRVLVLPETNAQVALGILEGWKQDLWLRTKLLETERDRAAQSGLDGDSPRALLMQRRLGHLATDIDLVIRLQRHLEAQAGRDETRAIGAAVDGHSSTRTMRGGVASRR